MRTASLAVVLGMLLATAPVSAQVRGSVRGSVIDRTTGAPLNNVLVRLQGTSFSARTDDRGVFAFEGVPSGVYSVVTSMIGYAPAGPISVRVAPGADKCRRRVAGHARYDEKHAGRNARSEEHTPELQSRLH